MPSLSNEDICKELNALIRLDFDAIEAYHAAIERLESIEYQQRLREFLTDHERHTVDLAEEVRALGGTPDDGPGGMRMLTEGSVKIGALGDDRGILHAMNTNEKITNRSYDSALEKLEGYPVQQLVRRNRDDERRHKSWIEQALER